MSPEPPLIFNSGRDIPLECAVAAGFETIVTGDADLLRLESYQGIEIVRVADFLARFSGRGR